MFSKCGTSLKYQGHSRSKIREMVMDTLAELGIEDKAKAFPSEFVGRAATESGDRASHREAATSDTGR